MNEISCSVFNKKGCYRSIANNSFSYLLTLHEFRKNIKEEIRPSWVKLTTITMISKFQNEIDIDKIRKGFKYNLMKGNIILAKKDGSGWAWDIKDTTFYNQITLVYNDKFSTKSIKIFPNGSIQVAGCSDLFDCRRIISQLAYIFNTFVDKTCIAPIETFRVVMINSNFSLNYKVNLRKIAFHFGKFSDVFKVSFEPDKYSAVKVKFQPANDMKEITTSIFGTGKIIITGAETLKEVAFAYNIINDTINNIENVRVSPCEPEKRELFDDFSGYKVNDVISTLNEKGFRSWKFTTKNRQINF